MQKHYKPIIKRLGGSNNGKFYLNATAIENIDCGDYINVSIDESGVKIRGGDEITGRKIFNKHYFTDTNLAKEWDVFKYPNVIEL